LFEKSVPPGIPPNLKSAVLEIISGQGSFGGGTQAMAAHYRRGGASTATLDLNAYLVTRLPATYAAVIACLRELPADFAPQSFLDAGSGPGTASWAAVETFPDISRIVMLDNNAKFLKLAKNLSVSSSHAALKKPMALVGDFNLAAEEMTCDLVVASYALAEVPLGKSTKAALALWRNCKQALVIIEPGTPKGFARILEARTALIAEGAHIVAPCTHVNACPMVGQDWCHFKVRLPRSREHLHAKNATVPFEDEKFSYLIASRKSVPNRNARILAPPLESKPAISFKLCSETGLSLHSVARRDRDEYKRVRKLGWGDVF
jgi:ribosomal protein RSM22 (predicted rRNA methylase)